MPSIIITGHPCSGKTTLANKIRERALVKFSSKIKNVIIINEENVCTDYRTINACYETSLSEKKVRGLLKSAFDRAVSASASASSSNTNDNDTLVILDSMNYIKGYRYELYCINKAANNSHCIVWCLNDINTCKVWNEKRRIEQQQQQEEKEEEKSNNNNNKSSSYSSSSYFGYYTDIQMNGLIQRYEPPDVRNRWDQPLYKIDIRSNNDKNYATDDKEVFNYSVYNMHNLSSTINHNNNNNNNTQVTDDEQQTTNINTQQQKVNNTTTTSVKSKLASTTFKKSATFKRAIKKPIENNTNNVTTTTTNQSSPSVVLGQLTAEALSALENNNDNGEGVKLSVIPTQQLQQQQQLQPPQPAIVPVKNTTTSNNTSQKNEPEVIIIIKTLDERIDEILNSFLLNVQPLRAGTSTIQHVATNSNVLHNVDSITQNIISLIISAQEKNVTGTGQLPISINNNNNNKTTTLYLTCHKRITTSEIKRIRRQYIQWITTHALEDPSEIGIAKSFIQYIETQR